MNEYEKKLLAEILRKKKQGSYLNANESTELKKSQTYYRNLDKASQTKFINDLSEASGLNRQDTEECIDDGMNRY